MNIAEIIAVLVNKTITRTEVLLGKDSVSWEDAKSGVRKILLHLTAQYPEHALFIREELEGWIDQQDKKRSN
jgi:hypothetical protein